MILARSWSAKAELAAQPPDTRAPAVDAAPSGLQKKTSPPAKFRIGHKKIGHLPQVDQLRRAAVGGQVERLQQQAAAAAEAGRAEATGLRNKLTLLEREREEEAQRLQTEVDALRTANESLKRQLCRDVERYEALMQEGLGLASAIAGDVDTVDGQLQKLGVLEPTATTPLAELHSHSDDSTCGSGSGGGSPLMQLLRLISMRCSHVTAHMQAPAAPRLPTNLSKHEHELRCTLDKLIHAEEAQQASLTCMLCLGVFDRPVSCVPCGHAFCKNCLLATSLTPDDAPRCPDCADAPVTSFVDSPNLDGLARKCEFKLLALKGIRDMFGQLSASDA